MKHIFAVILCAIVTFSASCSRSRVRLSSLTDADWQAMQKKAETLCAAYIEPKERDEDGDVPALRGDGIPESLRYLNPQRVWIRSNSVTVELWHTPAGDDTIYIDHSKDGSWMITIHEGSFMNKERVVWTSKKPPNQSSQPNASSGHAGCFAPTMPATRVAGS